MIDSEDEIVVALAPDISSASRTAVPLTPVLSTGLVSVLLERVSVVLLPTNVVVKLGKVTTFAPPDALPVRVVVVSVAPAPNLIVWFAVEIASPTKTDFATPKPPSV